MSARNFEPWAHVISVSGGKDSTATYLLALERRERTGRDFTAVFADVGNEHEWTYEFVRELPRRTGGPDIKWVRADFTEKLAKKRAFIEKFWPSRGVPDDKVRRALELLYPTGNPFLDLALWKTRFPGAKSRFCTEELKVIPMAQQVHLPLTGAGRKIISWQGVRGDESFARSLLPTFQRVEVLGIPSIAYRPLLKWTREDVFAMHDKHGIPRNPLYDHGMNRVGCLPCIMAKKSEIREIATRFPEHIDRIAQWEELVAQVTKRSAATFFSTADDPTITGDVDPTLHGIRAKVEWSKTSHGGRQYDMMLDAAEAFGTACSQYGACE